MLKHNAEGRRYRKTKEEIADREYTLRWYGSIGPIHFDLANLYTSNLFSMLTFVMFDDRFRENLHLEKQQRTCGVQIIY